MLRVVLYFRSRPYWNTAVVGRPFGSAEPENAAPVALTDGAPVRTGVGDDCTSKVAATAVSAPMTTWHVAVPEHPPPLQPANPEPAAGLAVSVTMLPIG